MEFSGKVPKKGAFASWQKEGSRSPGKTALALPQTESRATVQSTPRRAAGGSRFDPRTKTQTVISIHALCQGGCSSTGGGVSEFLSLQGAFPLLRGGGKDKADGSGKNSGGHFFPLEGFTVQAHGHRLAESHLHLPDLVVADPGS